MLCSFGFGLRRTCDRHGGAGYLAEAPVSALVLKYKNCINTKIQSTFEKLCLEACQG
jgi:hypothetical protein